jgi:hypothetical protein
MTMSESLVWTAVTAAFYFTTPQRGRLHKIQAIRSVTIEQLHGLQQGVVKEFGAASFAEAVKLQADLVCEQLVIMPFREESCIAYQNTIDEVFEELVATPYFEGQTTRSWQRRERFASWIRRWRVSKHRSVAPALTTSPIWLIAPKCWNDFAYC